MRFGILAATALLVIVTVARVTSTYNDFSQTMDEPVHVAAGYEWLAAGTYAHDPEHPPLARIPFALDAFVSGADVAPGSHGNELLYRDGRYLRNLTGARAQNLLFLILALSVVLVWARRLFGWTTALIATALFATLPPILGHAGLATTDLAGTASTTLALLMLALWIESPSWPRSMGLGVSVALGILVKFSFLVFFPVGAVVLLAVRFREIQRQRLKRALGLLPAGPIVFVLVWAAYRFDVGTVTAAHLQVTRAGSALHVAAQYAQAPGYEWVRAGLIGRYHAYGEYAASRGHTGVDFVDWAKAAGYPSPSAGRSGRDTMRGGPPIPSPPLSDRLLEPLRGFWQHIRVNVPIPAPYFAAGLEMVREHAKAGHPAFFLGETNRRGWWYYFPVVWLFKTPVPFVLLTFIGVGMLARHSWRTRNGESLAIAIMPVLMFLPTFTAGINIGVRHVLPVYPFMSIAAAFAVRELWRHRMVTHILAAALLLWQLASTTMAHPDYLAWFNELAGDHPERIALDSNLDWGQDLLRLSGEVRRSNIDRLYLAYFGSAIPERHGIPAVAIPPGKRVCGWIAASEMPLAFNEDLAWLRGREFKRVGKSIRLYRVECLREAVR